MINELKKVGNAIMIFDTFDWGVCSVSLPLYMYFLALSAKRHFICDGNTHTDPDTLHRNLPLYALKKQNKNSSLLMGFHKTRTGERSVKVLCTLMRTVA